MSKANESAANIRMPVGRMAAYRKMIVTIRNQLLTIQANEDYPNRPDLQAAAVALQAELDGLTATVQGLSEVEVQARVLRIDRGQRTARVKRGHDLVVSIVNKICNGDVAVMASWGGKPGVRAPADPSVDAPEGLIAKAGADPGSLFAKVRSDRTAVCYLFHCGVDQDHPESWAPPVIEAGCTHRQSGWPPGTKLWVRAAIQRRKTGLGHWSDMVQVTVR